ncbi:MAG TPA: hypothetical protein EYP29_03540 [Thermoplasmata archaeon]|nr:hypothetical protein [Thermoplasmata archaeon]
MPQPESMSFTFNLEKSNFFKKVKNLDELVWVGGAFISYILSLISGTIDSGREIRLLGFDFDPVSFSLWFIFGLITLFCLYMAFFDMWIHGLRLLIVYFLAGAGVIALTVFSDKTIYFFAGIVCIGSAVVLILEQIWAITKIRVRLYQSSQVEDEDAFSLGFWYLYPFLFLVLSILAFYSWYKWFSEESSLLLYILFEIGLIVLVIVIMWIPQNVLYYGQNVPVEFIQRQREHKRWRRELPVEAEVSASQTTGLTSLFSRTITKVGKMESCSQCGVSLNLEHKKCPNCGHLFEFGWCPRCELYNFLCPSCSNTTIFGMEHCLICGEKLSRVVECPDCHRKFPLRRLQEPEK